MNLADVIAGHGDDSPALISRGEVTSYGELRRLVGGARGALASLGVRADDRVVILAGNTRHFVVAYLAVVGLGAIAVPLNPGEPGPAVHAALEHVEPVAVVVDPVGSTTWASVDRATVPASVRHIVVAGRDAMADEASLEQLSTGELMAAVDVTIDHVAALLFTSGTAGAPRAAMLTHGNLLANIAQSSAVDGALRASDVVLCVLPLFHIFGLNVVLGQTLSAGGSIVLVQRFDPATALDTIVERKITIVPGRPKRSRNVSACRCARAMA
jgi:long-chain acyl-CoA synthetase